MRGALIAVLAVLAAACLTAAQMVFAQRIDVPVPEGPFRLAEGAEPVCVAIAQRIQEARVAEHLGGLPPLDAAAFSTPQWETLNPAQHAEIVRELVSLSHLAEAPAFRLAFADRRLATFEPQESLDQLWRVYGRQTETAIHAGRFRLQRATIDADNDGEGELIFRFTEYPGTCAAVDSGESDSEDWTYQALLRDDRRLALHYGASSTRADFFTHGGRTYRFDYRATGAEVIDPQIVLGNPRRAPLEIGDRPVCYFETTFRLE
jgi:hypothetical protein